MVVNSAMGTKRFSHVEREDLIHNKEISMDAKIIKCFIASPSDVQEERKECDEVVESLNRALGDSLNIHLETIRWEKDAHAAIGTDGQAVINEQLHPEDADFFIGIFWTRFGAPTPRAESGTEEEFERAHKRWQETHSNKIQFYFKEANPSYGTLDGEQFDKVKKFRDKISLCGCFYKGFKSKEEFSKFLYEALQAEVISMVKKNMNDAEAESIQRHLDNELHNSLSVFSNPDIVWIDRKICENQNFTHSLAESYDKAYDAMELINSDESCVIKAPPQHGLTCLAHYLRSEAWRQHKVYVYIDAETIKLRKLDDAIQEQLDMFKTTKITGIIIDAWKPDMVNAQKIIELLSAKYPKARLIIMMSALESLQALKMTPVKIDRRLKCLHLLPLAKSGIRKAVASCVSRFNADENSVLNKIVLNMEALNIHRTPMNCWTLLKVAEENFDIGPVNRTEMLERVLFILFNLNDIPSYTTKPDAKDCECVLGGFCEMLIKEFRTDFTEDEFRKSTSSFITRQLIDVDINLLWSILTANKIIVHVYGSYYRFGASFWLFYFAAKRMELDGAFKDYVLSEKHYAQYPEIIEFYTGSGRDKADVLKLLDEDLIVTRDIMVSKLDFPRDFNPLDALMWRSSKNDADHMHKIITDAVNKSSVPDDIKDCYADKNYNLARPYDQSIHNYVEGASFFQFIQQIRALSRALRNSDYVAPELKLKILQHIISGWIEIARVLFFMTPSLTTLGRAYFEGYGFYLDDTFKKGEPTDNELFVRILQECPHNVISLVKDDLSSQRQASLLYKWENTNDNAFAYHLYILYLIAEQPRGWEKRVQLYLSTLDSNSFYLLNTLGALRYYKTYGYISVTTEQQMGDLIKSCLVKHFRCSASSIPQKDIPENVNKDE